MKILYLTASPTYVFLDEPDANGNDQKNYEKLDLWPELREVTEVLFEARAEGHVDLEVVPEVRTEDLRRYLNHRNPNILHFSGHGDHNENQPEGSPPEANLLLQGEYGQGQYVSNDWLKEQIKDKNINIVVLNCCWSEQVAESLKDCVDLVIGTTAPLRSDLAAEFSRTFYKSAQEGLPLENILENVKKVVGESLYVFLARDEAALKEVVIPEQVVVDPKSPAGRVLAFQKRMQSARSNIGRNLLADLSWIALALTVAFVAFLWFDRLACEECNAKSKTELKACAAPEKTCAEKVATCPTCNVPLRKQYVKYLSKLINESPWMKYEPYAIMTALAAGPLARLLAAFWIFAATGIANSALPLMGSQSKERIILNLEEGQLGDMDKWLKEFES